MKSPLTAFCLILLGIASAALRAQAPTWQNRPPTVPQGYVPTPFGYYHPTCVKHLAEGDVLREDEGLIQHADGSLDIDAPCGYPRYGTDGEAVSSPGEGEIPTSFSQNWIETESTTTSSSYGELAAVWQVPPAPTSIEGQILYFFPGLEQTIVGTRILQPVLAWNRDFTNSWSIASWNALTTTNNSYEGTPKHANPGDTIEGTIMSTCAAGTLTCPSWNVTTEDLSSGVTSLLNGTTSSGLTFNWAASGTLEAAFNLCTDFPPNGSITFSSVALLDNNFNQIPNPGWTLHPYYTGLESAGLIAPCIFGGQATATIDTLDYGVPQAATPWESWANVTYLGGEPPTTLEYSEILQDDTPGATIHYYVVICGSPTEGTTIPNSEVDFYVPCNCEPPYGSMYATAPGYSQSQTTSISF